MCAGVAHGAGNVGDGAEARNAEGQAAYCRGCYRVHGELCVVVCVDGRIRKV